jgi:hypothetical protein
MLSLRFGFLVAWLGLRLAIGIVRLGWGLVRRQRETREGWGGFGAVDPGREQRWVVRTVAFVEIDQTIDETERVIRRCAIRGRAAA